MQITLAGKHVELSDALRYWVSEQLRLSLKKSADRAQDVQITFGKERSFFTCDIMMRADTHLTVRGHGKAVDVHVAFNLAIDHIVAQIRRKHRLDCTHSRREVALMDVAG
jgi:ribosomal subunit interface protein